MANKQIGTSYFLQLTLGAALIVFGIMALNGYNSAGQEALRGLNKMFGKSNNLFPVIFGIVELAAGAVLIVELFVSISSGLFKLIHLIICIFWLVNIIFNFVLSNLVEPDLIRWLGALLPQIVILLALWQVGEQN